MCRKAAVSSVVSCNTVPGCRCSFIVLLLLLLLLLQVF
jgi:hypothetical protein